ncbi:MAG TPA: hypothetical protein VIP11_26285 [Gemmatimonadaceae bacterium]
MNAARCWIAVVVATIAGCASIRRSLPEPTFTQGTWRIRVDVDSAPSRRASDKPVFGTIDFATARYSIDFGAAIAHRLPNGAYVVALSQPGDAPSKQFKITLGDSSSFDEKVVLVGRQVKRDSIVGTWSETVMCCSAGGRFSLWRAPRG